MFKKLSFIKNHPKKILFFGTLSGLGFNYGQKKYQEHCLMRAYCEEALKYGEVSHALTDEERHITVILNPAANSGKGKSKYEKYCAPLLHLSGLKVALVKTEHEDQAKQIMEIMDNTHAVVVAGGDGTLSEILTGLLRRPDSKAASSRFPLGILPLGEKNDTASSIWGFRKSPEVRHLAEATMNIVRNVRRKMDVMQITPVEADEDGSSKKPVYAGSQIEWGALRDARERKSVYWYWMYLKKYIVYVFSSYKDLSWNCSSVIEYVHPCKGCSQCADDKIKQEIETTQTIPRRWWHAFVPRTPVVVEDVIDYSKIINEDCGKQHQMTLENVSEVRISSSNVPDTTDLEGHQLYLCYGKKDISSFEFIKEGWRRENGEDPSYAQKIVVGDVLLIPSEDVRKDKKDNDRKMSIDNEDFEVRSMKIRPLPEAVTIFAPPKVLHSIAVVS